MEAFCTRFYEGHLEPLWMRKVVVYSVSVGASMCELLGPGLLGKPYKRVEGSAGFYFIREFPKIGVPYFGVLIRRILLFRVLY